jgi:hypothetical protein
LDFNGTNFVDVSPIPFLNSTFSLSACFRQRTGNSGFLFFNGPSATANRRCFSVFLDGSQSSYSLQIHYSNDGGVTFNTFQRFIAQRFDDFAWHQFGLAFKGTGVEVYLDGVQIISDQLLSIPRTCVDTGAVSYLGQRAPGAFRFVGQMQSVTLYSSTLTSQQLLALPSCSGNF